MVAERKEKRVRTVMDSNLFPTGRERGWRLGGREEVRERGRDEAGGWGWGAEKSEVSSERVERITAPDSLFNDIVT